MPNLMDTKVWKKINFEEGEEILSVAYFHKNPNVAQVLMWRALSPTLTAKYCVLLTTKRVVIVPFLNVLTLVNWYVPFENIKIIQDDGAIEVKLSDKKPFRIYPDSMANKGQKFDAKKFAEILRAVQQRTIQEETHETKNIQE